MKIKSLTIYCSSVDLLNKEYYLLAEEIGKLLGKKKISVIYGGGNTGLMGKVANAAYQNGSTVIGIIPEFLKQDEKINYNITKTIIVKNMTERKKILFDKADAFLILPGGSGTIEEVTEIISWYYLKLHSKPIIIFDYKNYWKSLFDLYNNMVKLNFGNKNLQSFCIIIKTLKEFKSLIS